jgi:hypothetical protein
VRVVGSMDLEFALPGVLVPFLVALFLRTVPGNGATGLGCVERFSI